VRFCGTNFFLSLPVDAKVELIDAANDSLEIENFAKAIVKDMKATPDIDPLLGIGLRLMVNDVRYYIQPVMVMLKSRPDEVCSFDEKNYLSYRCLEGQPDVQGCHLLFLNAQGKLAGLYTLQVKEANPHYCNYFPAMGIADKSSNSMLVTVQYFIPAEGRIARKISELGSSWYRMTILIRVKENNGRIEVEQDDACLGNPNRVDTVPLARKLLRRCAQSRP
jgi:hypothetical protein